MFPLCACAVLGHSVVSDSAASQTIGDQTPVLMGILPTRILEWVAMTSSRDLPNPDLLIRTQCDWHPYEKGTFGHRQTHMHIQRNVGSTVCVPRSVHGC